MTTYSNIKSAVFDFADTWIDPSVSLMGIRSIDFYDGTDTLIPLAVSDFIYYQISSAGAQYDADNAFVTALSKLGSWVNTSWVSNTNDITDMRIICVFDSVKSISKIIINNNHHFTDVSNYTKTGVKNIKINLSTDTITDTTFEAAISNSVEVFDGQIPEHVALDQVDNVVITFDTVTTAAPTTAGPTTVGPTSLAPTTIVTTLTPTTVVPTTLSPTTLLLTTLAPTTLIPTTALPTTLAPTTTPPTVGPTTLPPDPVNGYVLERNGRCLDGSGRCKWDSLGRTMASQSSNAIDEKGRMFTWGQNYNFQSGQGDWHYIAHNVQERGDLLSIEYATQIGIKEDWVKAESGELSTIAMNKAGELWGWGYAEKEGEAFGLPPDSGVSRTSWSGGPAGDYFPDPVRVTPGYTWKDFTHNYYITMAIDENDKLWVWGMNYSYMLGMDPPAYNAGTATPLQHTELTDDVKLIDCEYGACVAVTIDDKVYVWSDGYYTYFGYGDLDTPKEITGLVIPVGETIVDVTCSGMGITVTLSDGSLWAAGEEYIFGDDSTKYPTGSDTFVKIPFFIGKRVVKVRNTALGARSVFVIDNLGNIWGWSWGSDLYSGNALPHPASDNEWMLIASSFECGHKWVDVVNNEHNECYQAIDSDGWLYTWGYQSWGPHLAIGAARNQTDADLDPNITDVVASRIYAGKAKQALDFAQTFTTLNIPAPSGTEYVQPLDQDKRHKPCGHWHLREFEETSELPSNCWMPSLSVYGDEVFFVACGKHLRNRPSYSMTGTDIMFWTYNIGAGTWELMMHEQLINASNYPGGVASSSDVYAFFNYKVDAVGGYGYYETYSNPAMGIWVHDGTTLEYTEWTDGIAMSGQNKLGVFTGGLVVLAYTTTLGTVLIKVSTDYGATWSTVKTLPILADRKDYSLVIDPNGYIYIAHQISTTSIKVERSIDNGANWTTQIASNYMMAGIEGLKLIADNTMLFVICKSATATAIERSENDGQSWATTSNEPGSSIIGSASNVVDGEYDYNIVLVDGDTTRYMILPSGEQYTVYGTMYNYIWDLSYGGYTWLGREIEHLSSEGEAIDISVQESNSTLEGDSGRYAYASYGFFSAPDHHVAVVLSDNNGVNWYVVSTPLGYNDVNEISDFKGCPLFCIKDIPYLNHIWTFERGTWAKDFVPAKDKYVKVNQCKCD